MPNSSDGLVAQRYWPLEEQDFFSEVCEALGPERGGHLRRALAEDWSGQDYTVNLPNQVHFNVAYVRESTNQMVRGEAHSGRRRILRVSWWASGQNRQATISMRANDLGAQFDSFDIVVMTAIPESIRQGLIGQPLSQLVELPEPLLAIGNHRIVDWATDTAPDRPTAILRQ